MEENIIQINGEIMINLDVNEKDYFQNPVKRNCENGKYLSKIMDDLAITCDEIIES